MVILHAKARKTRHVGLDAFLVSADTRILPDTRIWVYIKRSLFRNSVSRRGIP
jgi:hypothetical protein